MADASRRADDDVALQAEGVRPPAGPAEEGRRLAGRLRQAENDLHAAEQALAQAKQRVESALAALGGDASIETDEHPLVLAALAKRDQAALDLEQHRGHGARAPASSRRPTGCRSASRSRRRRRR